MFLTLPFNTLIINLFCRLTIFTIKPIWYIPIFINTKMLKELRIRLDYPDVDAGLGMASPDSYN